MGAEATCTARFRGLTTAGKARLETEVLQFRGGDLRLSIPFKQMSKVTARTGTLSVTYPAGHLLLELGAVAPKWMDKILHPPSRLQKIGVKADWRVSAVGVDDPAFLRELKSAVDTLSIGRVERGSDAIFYGVSDQSQLARLEQLKMSLKPNGALWIIRPKGRPEISERATMAAGKAAGLVDVKVVGFSTTHTAEKFVIPIRARS
ncbi:MAG: hypothetical protein ACRD2I_14900 [Vicinamibacterales bacterium]